MQYSILVIDEQQSEIDQFQNFFDLADDFTVYGMNQIDEVEDLYSIIRKNNIDAVAFDYRLMEYGSPFQMNGDKYLRMLLEHYQNFPAFIITNKVQDAKVHQIDPFRVIDKELININPDNAEDKEKGLELIQNIRFLIDNYRKDISEKETELKVLLERQFNGEKLKALESQRIVELDDYLESTFSKANRIPTNLKENKTLETLSDLVAKTDALLKSINKDE